MPGQSDIKEYYKIKIMEIVNTWPMIRQEDPFNGTESQKSVGCPQQSGPSLALSTGDSQAAELVVISHRLNWYLLFLLEFVPIQCLAPYYVCRERTII